MRSCSKGDRCRLATLDDAGRSHPSNGCPEVRLWEVCQISNGKRHVCTHLASSRSCQGQNQLDQKSAIHRLRSRPLGNRHKGATPSLSWTFERSDLRKGAGPAGFCLCRCRLAIPIPTRQRVPKTAWSRSLGLLLPTRGFGTVPLVCRSANCTEVGQRHGNIGKRVVRKRAFRTNVDNAHLPAYVANLVGIPRRRILFCRVVRLRPSRSAAPPWPGYLSRCSF